MILQVVNDRSIFKYLDNQVARLALKLPVGDFAKMSKDIAQVLGGHDVVDGDEDEEDEEVL